MILNTDFIDFATPEKGKVRDIYDLGTRLLIVSTDRISAYDHILPQGIPDKGIILNRMSEYWFEKTRQIVRNHFVSSKVKYFPRDFQKFHDELDGRTMLVTKTDVIPVEFIVRGYLAGSSWKSYEETGTVFGLEMQKGLMQCQRLPEPILTPTTKAESGNHDENITFNQVCEITGKDVAEKIRDICFKLYNFCSLTCERMGVYLGDTKFEFGFNKKDGELMLIDEVVTPDSSRFWLRATHKAGQDQEYLDKQVIRNYLNSLEWNKKPPVPDLSQNIINKTRYIYLRLANYHLKIDMPGLEY